MITKKFDELLASDVNAQVQLGKFEAQAENDQFYDDDHWQGGVGFVDQTPPPSHLATATIKTGIARVFTPENLIKQVVRRRISGVLGSSPKISVTKSGSEQDKEIQLAIADWFRKKCVLDALKRLVRYGSLHDKAYLRIIIPEGRAAMLEKAKGDPKKVLNLLYVDVVTRESATVYTDPTTMGKIGMYVYSLPDNQPKDPATKKKYPGSGNSVWGEVSYVDFATGDTILRVIPPDGSDESVQETRLPIGERILMYEVKDLLLITETVRQQQRSVNTTRTHMMINNKATDWQRRIFFNAQPPGSLIEDPTSGEKIAVTANTISSIPGTDTYLQGIVEDTPDGERIKDPSGMVIDPGGVQRFVESEAAHRRGLLRDVHQLHTELGDMATSTGESREKAMDDYKGDLQSVAAEIDDAGQWLLETVWELARHLSGSKEQDVSFRFEALINTGHIDNDRKRANLEEVGAGIISRATAAAERGIEDPESEMILIEADDYQRSLMVAKMADAVKKLTDSGSSLRGALEFFRVPEAMIKKMEEIDLANDPGIDPAGDPNSHDVIVAPSGDGQ